MTTTSFDPTLYTARAPAINLQNGLTLARALVAAVPSEAPPAMQKSAARLTKVADGVQNNWGQRQREAGQINEDTRQLDNEADVSWGILRDRLETYGRLPVARFPKAKRAQELAALLFPSGLTFLSDTYSEQLAAMDTLLKRIDQEALQADIDAIAGPEFLEQIRHVHPRYEKMVQERYGEPENSPSLIEARQTLSRAILTHATKVIASIDEDDPATLTAARAALKPIDTHREKERARRNSASQDDGAPSSPKDPNHQPDTGAPSAGT